MFPLFVVLVFGVLVFMKCNFLFTTKIVLVTLKGVFFTSISVTSLVKDPKTVLLLLAGPHWPCREAGDSGAEVLGVSGPGVGS